MADGNPPRDENGQFVSQDRDRAQETGVDDIEQELAAIREQQSGPPEQPPEQSGQPQPQQAQPQQGQQPQGQQGQPQQGYPQQGQQPAPGQQRQGQGQAQPQQAQPQQGQSGQPQRQPQQGQPQGQPAQQPQQVTQPQQQVEGAGDGRTIVDRPADAQAAQQGQQQSAEAFGPEGDFSAEQAQSQTPAYEDNPVVQSPQEQQAQQMSDTTTSRQQEGREKTPDEEYEMWSEVVNEDSATGGVEVGGIYFEIHPLPRKVRNDYMRQFPPGLFDAMQMAQDTNATEDGQVPEAKRDEIESEIDQIDMIPTREGTEALINTIAESLWHPRISGGELRDYIRRWDDSVVMAVALRAIALSAADTRVADFRFD